MNNMTKFTAIPPRVKAAVTQRDNGRCIICGTTEAYANAHIIRRSQGGRGIEQNIVMLCPQCHYSHDEGLFIKGRLDKLGLKTQQDVENYVIDYIKGYYPDWTPESVTYHKWD